MIITRNRVQTWLSAYRPDVSLVEAEGRKGYSCNGQVSWSGILWAHVALDLGMVEVPDTLVCTECDERKPLDAFNTDKRRWHRRALVCKACNAHALHDYYEENREEILSARKGSPTPPDYSAAYYTRKRAAGWRKDWRTGKWEKEKDG